MLLHQRLGDNLTTRGYNEGPYIRFAQIPHSFLNTQHPTSLPFFTTELCYFHQKKLCTDKKCLSASTTFSTCMPVKDMLLVGCVPCFCTNYCQKSARQPGIYCCLGPIAVNMEWNSALFSVGSCRRSQKLKDSFFRWKKVTGRTKCVSTSWHHPTFFSFGGNPKNSRTHVSQQLAFSRSSSAIYFHLKQHATRQKVMSSLAWLA